MQKKDKKFLYLIGFLSVATPLVIAVLFYMPKAADTTVGFDLYFLPRLNAVLNSTTALLLVIGYYFIRKGNRQYHITAMVTAFILSSLFLISYVVYHSYATHTLFGDANGDQVVSEAEILAVGFLRPLYQFILLSHILLSIIIVPLVLFSIYFGWRKQYVKHRKISKWTFPLWLYVAVTGVLVYLMISPYYPV